MEALMEYSQADVPGIRDFIEMTGSGPIYPLFQYKPEVLTLVGVHDPTKTVRDRYLTVEGISNSVVDSISNKNHGLESDCGQAIRCLLNWHDGRVLTVTWGLGNGIVGDIDKIAQSIIDAGIPETPCIVYIHCGTKYD